MKRNVIEIDRELCNGCGQCVDACAEGAIQLVDGRAAVVKDEYCDGLGACLGECPTGALRVIEREAPEFDAAAAERHVRSLRGESGVERMRQQAHAPLAAPSHVASAPAHAHAHAHGGGCPGSRVRELAPSAPKAAPVSSGGLPAKVNPSELTQWPVQLHLVPTTAPFFQGKELVVLATCGPVASADVHWRFLRGRSVVVACPKLDITDPYVEKLAAIFAGNGIPKVQVVRLEVPCCGGLTRMVELARRLSGRTELVVEEVTLGLDGEVRSSREI